MANLKNPSLTLIPANISEKRKEKERKEQLENALADFLENEPLVSLYCSCGKLLAKMCVFYGKIEIKCRHCKQKNIIFSIDTYIFEHLLTKEKE